MHYVFIFLFAAIVWYGLIFCFSVLHSIILHVPYRNAPKIHGKGPVVFLSPPTDLLFTLKFFRLFQF